MAPTAAFSPGFVYRQTQSKEVFFVEEIPVTPREFEVALGGYSATFNTESGLTANLQAPLGGLLGNARINENVTRTSKVSFDNGRFMLMKDADERQAIQSALAIVGNTRVGERYFIVRDAIQANGIEMNLTNQDTRQLGGQASVTQLLSLTPNLTVTQGETLNVSRNFKNPLNVCIRAVEIHLPDKSAGPVPVGDPQVPSRRTYASPSEVISILNSRNLPPE